jgi:hypothetical protein
MSSFRRHGELQEQDIPHQHPATPIIFGPGHQFVTPAPLRNAVGVPVWNGIAYV